MSFKKDPNEIGVLWLNVSANNKRYYSGEIDGIGKCVAFPNKTNGGKEMIKILRSAPPSSPPGGSSRPSRPQQGPSNVPGSTRPAEDDF